MNKVKALVEYFMKKYPGKQYIFAIHIDAYGTQYSLIFPDEFKAELEAFFAAWGIAYTEGYADASKVAAVEYSRNIYEVSTQMYAAGYNKGYADGNEQGFDQGIAAELEESLIPSDAYDVEVFAVQPSNDFATGQQAFIGYKVDVEGQEQPQFGYIQVQFAVPNLQPKNKISNEKVVDFSNLRLKENN